MLAFLRTVGHAMTLLSITFLGFFLGMRHATDPDHVIAVTTLVTRHRNIKHAAVIGLSWGLGHTLTILVVGGGIILLGWVIPARIGLSMEFSVGLMLILLGVMNLKGIGRLFSGSLSSSRPLPAELHSHAHSHGDTIHTCPHRHQPEVHPHGPDQTPLSWLDRHFGRMSLYQLARPLVVGIVHGLAGSTAVAFLVLTAIQVPGWALAYLVVFGIGTIVGMMLITAAIGLSVGSAGKLLSRLNWAFRAGSGLVSLAFGFFLVYQTGFVSGLFTGHPHWTPR